VHPGALVDSRAIGPGTRIWAFTHVCEGAVIGADCNVGEGCYIEGGSRIGDRVTVKNGVMIWEGVAVEDDAFIGPGVVFTNDMHPRSARSPAARARYRDKTWLQPTLVGRGASIGANATIASGIAIGAFAMIGAGAVVTADIAPYAIAAGVPARARGWACACGETLALRAGRAECGACGARYRRTPAGVAPAPAR
jgi:acetyltransferase-like isoleucine patch superfamily enzyme